MIVTIPDVLTVEQVAQARVILDQAEWVDGKVTAGHQSSHVKNNQQIPENSAPAQQLGDMVMCALEQSPLFISAALPLRVFPPLFNRYSGGHSFGIHVDNAIRQLSGTSHRIRTDLSVTLFFSDPADYDGGELCIEDVYGIKRVKLPAGHMVVYPSTSLHEVKPVTRGTRTCSFFWLQSMIREDANRTILFDLDTSIQLINRDHPNSPYVIQLTGIYHNLLRKWAEM